MVKDHTEEKNLKSKGVYLISHKSTNIKYVGSTTSNFAERWRAHLNTIRRGIGNRVLVNICNKYGIEGFKFSIIEELPNSSIEEIRIRERYWIDTYDTYHNGANCSVETTCAFINYKRRKYTEEDKLKYMLASKSKRKVYLYDENGVILYSFPSSVACDRFFEIKKGRTNWAINHNLSIKKLYYPSYEEKVWNPKEEKYKKKCEVAKKVANIRKSRGSYIVDNDQKRKIRINNPNRKKVALYDLEGNFIKQFDSLNECDDFLNLYRGTTSKVFRGLTKVLRKKYIPKLI